MTFVLVVDDEPAICRTLRINLKARGYEVETATDGRSALQIARERTPDVVILDLGLPDIDGVTVLSKLREFCASPVIVLSARHGSDDKVESLDAGADDYVTKPFGMDEFLARVRAQVRRTGLVDAPAPVVTDAFEVNFEARTVTRDGKPVRLTPTEWKIVDVLVRNADRLVSQQTLLHEVWGPSYSRETNYLRVYLAQLRRKLEPDPAHPRYFVTEPGMGYRFIP
ncbi:Two component transcriptional regulator, winged helix family OS=Tsukamurella paurometabola (strain ATCC 8368 / DSM / CCUG 35730 / CIP 100753 / JCM 10117/ KCTC 9821 / NBRC 16120 / NCIMB 702349 / NCTC 13040) OX=521096 GN=Tpau_3248 PE=4 SV=1 [Tsukamurella paurometabola]|uniref:Two component transcriptional regulator, winged helix family n=1 Tax=Tsukamurella paurometabola (strain ATCC 8368 / DSM 20162 / CCUG 35730 / CIP 100753 / JCM 10117 / KCTC 9821 / NBRC 16120 / NCIMB 702349 / NCTC 13040) TaxID=521096 RepID=D5UVQ1_TSUPD|nr:response regulator transcription factor [Tsukamurella paurometabola]ADG79833.1 two component transcriptional regulator, winged helix family [Tsukamurella paurometabola DSM 20162]SUP37371.1 KDP operon transcriptional regulatory protein KdpE [Tsukamurella paurometabola]